MADDFYSSLSDMVPNELDKFYGSEPARVLDKYRDPATKRLDPNAVTMDTLDRAGIKYDPNDPYAQEAKNEAENQLRFGQINRDAIKSAMTPQPMSLGDLLGGIMQKAGGVVAYAQHTPGAENIFNNTELDRYAASKPEAQKELREALLKSTLQNTDEMQKGWMAFSQKRLQARMDARQKAGIIAARADDPAQGARAAQAFLAQQGFPQDAANFKAPATPKDVAQTPQMPEAATVVPPPGAPPAAPAPNAGPPMPAAPPSAGAGAPPSSGIPAPPPGQSPGPTLAAVGRLPTGALPPSGIAAPPPGQQPGPTLAALDRRPTGALPSPAAAAPPPPEPQPLPPKQLAPADYAPPNQNDVDRLLARQRRLLDVGDAEGAKQAGSEADLASKRYRLQAVNKDGDRAWVDNWGRENPKMYAPDAGNQERRDAEAAGGDTYYEYLKKTKGATYAARAKAIADFNQEPLGSRASGSMMGDVQLIDPKYNVADYQRYKKTMLDYAAGGKIGQNAIAARTALDHVGNLLDVIPRLHNSSMLPSISNRLHSMKDYELDKSPGGDRYQDAYADFKMLGGGVSTELDKTFKGAAPDVAGMKDIKETLDNPYAPPNALVHSAGSAVHMLGQRLYEMKQAHDEATMGKDPNWSPLSPHAQQVYDKIAAQLGIDTPWKAPPGSDVPEGAVQDLIKNPSKEARSQFNEAFGKDADQRVLEEGIWSTPEKLKRKTQ
jgi:hypothetical protein